MTTAVALLLAIASLAVLSLRPEIPAGARTPRQLRDAVRRTSAARCAVRVLWAVIVVALLTLASASASGARLVYEVATLLWLLATGLAEFGNRPAMTGGHA
jgi:hypothetical protein